MRRCRTRRVWLLGVLLTLVVFTVGVSSAAGGGLPIQRVSVSTSGQQGDGASWYVFLSPDGRFVCFTSSAANLVAGDTNGFRDTILRDLQEGTTERVSISPGGQQGDGYSVGGPVSLDGRYVAFTSEAKNLGPAVLYADALLRDRVANTLTLASVTYDGSPQVGRSYADDMTPDARFVVITTFTDKLFPGEIRTTRPTWSCATPGRPPSTW